MIRLTRFNGETFSLNPDLIEKVEAHPDTVITLVDDTKYMVRESEADVDQAILDSRARVIVAAQMMAAGQHTTAAPAQDATVVPFPGNRSGD